METAALISEVKDPKRREGNKIIYWDMKTSMKITETNTRTKKNT
jgi:hypothetical protein